MCLARQPNTYAQRLRNTTMMPCVQVYEELLQSLPADAAADPGPKAAVADVSTAANSDAANAGTSAQGAAQDVAASDHTAAQGAAAAGTAANAKGAESAAATALRTQEGSAQPDAGTAVADPGASAPVDAGAAATAPGAAAAQNAAAPAADYSSLIAQEVTTLKDKKQRHFCPHDTGIRTLLFLEQLRPWPGAGPREVRACWLCALQAMHLVRSTRDRS